MDDRFRIDGIDLGVDRRRSVVTVDASGQADATICAAGVPGSVVAWATVPPRILIAKLPLRFDGEAFGATLDQGLHDDLMFTDGGAWFSLSSRFDVFGRVTSHAGDRLRLVGTVETPWSSEPWRLDVSIAFGGRRGAAV